MLVQLHVVGRIALVSAGLAFTALAGILAWITHHDSRDYQEIISAHLQAEEDLHMAALMFGLLAAAVAGIATWLIALYSSFRIAGPLFRFSRNLAHALEHGPVAPVPIRRDDFPQNEARVMKQATRALREHYESLALALNEIEDALREVDDSPGEKVSAGVHRLRELDRAVRL